ncbi:acetyltransferase [Hoeflea sp. WL0058]|uniref:Acetyltransferase n=1 Tax=Flavimaribacter sediminis TaxID=2865987 RepID=A0AAE2ZK84_9HYPH|nr:acetyltransferase [Flavimaribacter sediminis]MBW8636207.1 acetyltransferase [Flavimaribacter sediminis]
MKTLIGIFGASGFAREVMPLLRAQLDPATERAVFVDLEGSAPINGYEVLDEASFHAFEGLRRFVVAIADAELRRCITTKAEAAGAKPFQIRSGSAEVLDNAEIGPGAILCGHTTVTSNVRIGVGFHLNIYSYVAHDSVIGDYVTFAPHVACNGNVVIEDGAYIGTGAVLRQGSPSEPLIIGAGAIVGMGAVVLKNVLPGATVVGIPAQSVSKRSKG